VHPVVHIILQEDHRESQSDQKQNQWDPPPTKWEATFQEIPCTESRGGESHNQKVISTHTAAVFATFLNVTLYLPDKSKANFGVAPKTDDRKKADRNI
jgi:hypothetical protein